MRMQLVMTQMVHEWRLVPDLPITVLLLDETLAGLGQDDLGGILDVIRRACEEGVTVLPDDTKNVSIALSHQPKTLATIGGRSRKSQTSKPSLAA